MKKLNITAAKELKKKRDKYQKEFKTEKKYQHRADMIYKNLTKEALNDINEVLINCLNNLIKNTLDELVSRDSAYFTGFVSPGSPSIYNDGRFCINAYLQFDEDVYQFDEGNRQKLREIFSKKYLNKSIVLKTDLGNFEGKIVHGNTTLDQDTFVLVAKGSVHNMLMQSFRDAGYHVELITDENNEKGIRVSL